MLRNGAPAINAEEEALGNICIRISMVMYRRYESVLISYSAITPTTVVEEDLLLSFHN